MIIRAPSQLIARDDHRHRRLHEANFPAHRQRGVRMVVVDYDDFYPRTPARAQARTIPDTPGAGIAMTARSTCSGTDAMLGNVFRLRISP